MLDTFRFPNRLPKEAKDIHFAYLASGIQGSISLQLRYRMPKAIVEEQAIIFQPMAINRFEGGDRNEHANLPNGVPTTFFYTGDSKNLAFPSDYEIFVLGSKALGPPKVKWNHGYSYGVAINRNTSDIVYWTEDW